MWDSVNITLGIKQCLDQIFSALLVGGIDRNRPENLDLLHNKVMTAKVCLSRFISDFPYNIFYNNYAVFYEILVTLNTKTFTADQLRSIIETNRDLILDSPYINTRQYASTSSGNIANDDDIIAAVTADLVDKLNELSYNVVTEEEFKSACNIYTDWYRNTFAQYVANNMAAIMQDQGFECHKPGKRVRLYRGLNDMTEYYSEQMRVIESLADEGRIRSSVIDDKWLEEEIQRENQEDTEGMFNIGIREMDETLGKLRRGNMIGIMGPPKGGKTRFTNFLVQRALSLGYNVCVWPLEGTKDEWLAMQTASFIARLSYEQTKSGKRDSMLRFSSKDILERKYKASPTMRKEVTAAKVAMATSEKYGRLSFIEGTAYVEDMFEVLKAHFDNENDFDVLVVDQLVNVMSRKGKGKVERISEAYMQMKDFLTNKLKKRVLGIMPAQLKQEAIDFIRRNPTETLDVTSGGESSETIRTPDSTIGLMSTKEERDNNIMKFYDIASRHSASFKDFQARCYLECCFFTSEDDEAK